MKIVESIYRRYSHRRLLEWIVVTLVISIILMMIITPAINAVTGTPTLDSRFGYTAEDVIMFFGALYMAGVPYYQYQLIVDSFYPICYSNMFSFALAGMQKRLLPAESPLHNLVVLPFIVALLDYCENLLLASQSFQFPAVNDFAIAIASMFTILKFILLVIVFGAVVIEVVLLSVWKLRKRIP